MTRWMLRIAALSAVVGIPVLVASPLASRPSSADADAVLAPGADSVPAVDLLGVRHDDNALERPEPVLGLALASLEINLADLPGVVPRSFGVPVGLTESVPPESRWTATVWVSGRQDDVNVDVRFCSATLECTRHSARAPLRNVTRATKQITVELAERLGRSAPDLPTPTFPNLPAAYEAGLQAANFHGLLQEQPKVHRTGAVSSMTQWIVGRIHSHRGRWHAAAAAYLSAHRLEPGRIMYMAAAAHALEKLDRGHDALELWRAVDAQTTNDPRFLVPHARIALGAQDAQAAWQSLERLRAHGVENAEIARLRVQAFDAINVREPQASPHNEALLTDWMARDPDATEPVRRLLDTRVKDGKLDDALELAEALSERTDEKEAQRLSLAVAVGSGAYDQAAEYASAIGEKRLARQLRAASLEDQPHEGLRVLANSWDHSSRLMRAKLLLEAGYPWDALELTYPILRRDPWWPEALEVQYRALVKLRYNKAARQTLKKLQYADPYWGVESGDDNCKPSCS